MPVTLQINSHPAQPFGSSVPNNTQTSTDALFQTAPDTSKTFQRLLHTSLPTSVLPRLVPVSNGLIHAFIQAYNQHQHLHIRPDDVWIAIITQFSFYVNAHAEGLRKWFVQHEGTKLLEVEMDGTPEGADYGWMAEKFSQLMEAELVPGHGLKEWILPEFTTTTKTDTAVEAGLMMCTLKSYFDFLVSFRCGIPSVTLLGTKEDWVLLRQRIDKFLEFGKEHVDLQEWHGLLGPVLDKFVETFSTATAEEQEKGGIRDFWNLICKQEDLGSSGHFTTGWLCFLCPFSNQGIWKLHRAPAAFRSAKESSVHKAFSETVFGKGNLCRWQSFVKTTSIPEATAYVPVKVDDNGSWFDGVLVTGLAGYEVVGEERDTLKPVPAWWMFEVDDNNRERDDRIMQHLERENRLWELSQLKLSKRAKELLAKNKKPTMSEAV